MGGIDLDAHGDPILSPMLGARQFRTPGSPLVLEPPGRGRVFAGVMGSGLRGARELLLALRRAWLDDGVKEAVVWTYCHEAIRACPWIWDAPLMTAFPFRRLPPQFFDDELNTLRTANPGSWGFLLYFPRLEDITASRGRFYGAAGRIGRVVEVGPQPADWRTGYRLVTGEDYPFDELAT
jgi:hypothetical protein